MTRRTLGLGLTLVSLCPALAGCDPLLHNLRQRDRDRDPDVTKTSAVADEVESTKILDVQSEPSQKKPFFKSSRLSGGLSDESREIESHFGIR